MKWIFISFFGVSFCIYFLRYSVNYWILTSEVHILTFLLECYSHSLFRRMVRRIDMLVVGARLMGFKGSYGWNC